VFYAPVFFFFAKPKIFNKNLHLRQQIWLITYHISTITLSKMQKLLRYTIFKTKWGYFGLAGTEHTLWRTCLPRPEPEKIRFQLLKTLQAAKYDKAFFRTLQEQIDAYFEGAYVDFSLDVPINLDGFSPFGSSVLSACRKIRFGQVITYSALAKKTGWPAVRAVGNALAKNPLPLIIPCHRVIRSDGQIGGFSAPGGKKLKEKLLKHELAILTCSKDGPDRTVLRNLLL